LVSILRHLIEQLRAQRERRLLAEEELRERERPLLPADPVEVLARVDALHVRVLLLGEVPDRPRPVDLGRGVPLIGLQLLVEVGLRGDLDGEPAMPGGPGFGHGFVEPLPRRQVNVRPRLLRALRESSVAA
jgi:hypothetical protein